MRIRSFIIAYALVLAVLLFADRRPSVVQQDHYSHVVDLTAPPASLTGGSGKAESVETRIISPAALIPGTWSSGQIPAERLIAPLVAIDVTSSEATTTSVTVDDIAAWESHNGPVPQGAVVAIRLKRNMKSPAEAVFPMTADAARFLMDARRVLGFAVESSANLSADRTLARQIALHGSYVVEGTTNLTAIPETGSLVIVAPGKNRNSAEAPVRLLAMVR